MNILADHLREFEGLRLEAYKCPAAVWTIGYGHTGPDVRPGMTITEEEAEALLEKDLAWVRRTLKQTVRLPLDPAQEAALCSLIFNIGEPNWRKSTVLKRLNNGNIIGAADAITMWNKARVDGKLQTLPGLVRRREAERALFLQAVEAGPVEDVPQEVEGGKHKPVWQSKELAAAMTGVIGIVGQIWADAQENLGPLIQWAGERAMYVLGALFIFFLANRLLAHFRGDR